MAKPVKMGRPPMDPKKVKVPVTHRLPRNVAEWLQDQTKSGALLVEEALYAIYDIPKNYKSNKGETE